MNSFLYLHCTDLDEARRFYRDGLGLAEIYFSADDRTAGYRVGSLQVTVEETSDVLPVDAWSKQLGWSGGSSPAPSWGFELDASEFARVVTRLIEQGTVVWQSEPDWVGYWSFPVKDPMDNTVEITSPDEAAWVAGGCIDEVRAD